MTRWAHWTEALAEAADGADLLISECYYYDKPISMHMNYVTLKEHSARLNARNIVLTHMSADMLQHVARIPEPCAYDGMVIEIP